MENRDLTKVIDTFINRKFEKRGLQKGEKLSAKAMQIIFQKDLWIDIVDIDPDLAKELLTRNFHNRVIKDSRLAEFRWNMMQGERFWMTDGSPIKFDTLGNLLDGQHRLTAVIDSKTTQKFVIVSGLEPRVFTIIDHHKPRSLGDTLHIAGYRNYSTIASALNTIFQVAFTSLAVGTNDLRTTKMRYFSNYDLLGFAESIGGDEAWAKLVGEVGYMNKNYKVAFTPSQTLGLLWILDQIDAKMGRQFMRDIYLGVHEYSNPAYLFRQRMTQYHTENEKKMPIRLMWAYFCKAWDNYYTGKTIGILSISKKENLRLKLNGIDKVRFKYPDYVK